MTIQSIFGKNFSNFNELSYSPSQGTTVISGENGSGKSSLFDLIRFATYGNCIKARKIIFFKKRGSKGALETKIVYDDYLGSTWEIYRKYEDKKSTAYVKVDTVEKANGTKNVDEFIHDNFISESLLFNSNIVQQKDASSFVEIDPAERFKLCLDMFQVEDLKKKGAMIKKDLDALELKNQASFTEVEVHKQAITDLKSKITMTDKTTIIVAIASAEKEIALKRTEKEAFTAKGILLQKELSIIEAQNKQIDESNQRRSTIAKEIQSLESDLQSVSSSIIQLNKYITSAATQISNWNIDVTNLISELEVIKPVRVMMFNEVELDEAYKKVTELSIEKSSLEKSIGIVKRGECLTCGQKTDKIGGGIEALNARLITIEEQLVATQLLIATLKTKKFNIEETVRNNSLLEEKKKTVQAKIDGVKGKILETETSVTNNKTQIASNTSLLGVYSLRIKDKTVELENTPIKELVSTSAIRIEITSNGAKIQSFDMEEQRINDKLVTYKTQINAIEAWEKDLEQHKLIIEQREKLIVEQQEELNTLAEVRELYEKKIPLYLILKKLEYIAFEANSFLHTVFDKFDIRFERPEAGDKLLIVFHDNYTGLPSEFKNLSGYESSIGSLAIRMGLSKYNTYMNSTPINFLGLDEADEAASSNNSRLLFDTISKMKGTFQQTILISHKPDVKEWLQPDNVITIKNDGFNSFIDKE